MEHEGIVTAVKKGSVTVQIESVSACASCQAHSRCGFAESKNKTLDIPTRQWQQYATGDTVTVTIDHTHGMQAVLIAYILPALLLLAIVVGLSLAGLPEWAVILLSLLSLGVYVLVLYLTRKKLDSRFELAISKHDPQTDKPTPAC